MYTLSANVVLSLWEELCIYAYVEDGNSLLEYLIHYGGTIYMSSKDSFVVSQLLSVARLELFFKLGSKNIWLYVSRTS